MDEEFPCENCGEYEGHHGSDGCCPSAKDYGKKFKPSEVNKRETKE